MAVLESTPIVREFQFKKNGKTIILDDINPDISFREVVKFYSGTYPELTTATITGPEFKDDKMVFTISTQAGTLG